MKNNYTLGCEKKFKKISKKVRNFFKFFFSKTLNFGMVVVKFSWNKKNLYRNIRHNACSQPRITRKTENYELMRLLAAVRSLKMLESFTNKIVLLFSFIWRAITILDCNFYNFPYDHNFYDLFTIIHSNHIITVLPMVVHYQWQYLGIETRWMAAIWS